MPNLPLIVWVAAAGVAVLLLGLCCLTAYAVMRRGARSRVAEWSTAEMLSVLAAATVPWLVVWLAPINVTVNIQTLRVLIGWVILALAAFCLLVLLPLAALLSGMVWWTARRRRTAGA